MGSSGRTRRRRCRASPSAEPHREPAGPRLGCSHSRLAGARAAPSAVGRFGNSPQDPLIQDPASTLHENDRKRGPKTCPRTAWPVASPVQTPVVVVLYLGTLTQENP